MKVLINRCFGGFRLTEKVFKELGIEWNGCGFLSNEQLGIKSECFYAYRCDERLIKAVEKIGLEESEGDSAKLKIVTVPDIVEWEIAGYDGMESIHEKHRVWGDDE